MDPTLQLQPALPAPADLAVAAAALWAHAAAAVLLAWGYFGRYRMTRPPIGVMGLGDVAIMMVFIVLIPYLYLALPLWLTAGLVFAGSAGLLYFVAEPVLRARPAVWLAVLGLCAADVAAARQFGTEGQGFFLVNNLVVVLMVVGVVNLWAQSGMKARDAAILGGALVVYDFVATSMLPLMADVMARLGTLPFAPMVAWRLPTAAGSLAGGGFTAMGMGDLLMAAVFPLVMRKGYGDAAGRAALGLGLAAIAGVIGLPFAGLDVPIFPVMVVLGPLMVAQYLFWRRRLGRERRFWEFEAALRR